MIEMMKSANKSGRGEMQGYGVVFNAAWHHGRGAAIEFTFETCSNNGTTMLQRGRMAMNDADKMIRLLADAITLAKQQEWVANQ